MDGYLTIVQHEEYAKRMDDEHKRQNKRIDHLEENYRQFNELTLSVKELALSVKSMVEEQKEQDKRIEILEGRDGEKWRTISMFVMTTVLGIIIGFVANSMGI